MGDVEAHTDVCILVGQGLTLISRDPVISSWEALLLTVILSGGTVDIYCLLVPCDH